MGCGSAGNDGAPGASAADRLAESGPRDTASTDTPPIEPALATEPTAATSRPGSSAASLALDMPPLLPLDPVSAGVEPLQVPGRLSFTLDGTLYLQDRGVITAGIGGGANSTLLAPALASDGRVAFIQFFEDPNDPLNLRSALWLRGPDGLLYLLRAPTGAGEFYWTPRWTGDERALLYAHQRTALPQLARAFDPTPSAIPAPTTTPPLQAGDPGADGRGFDVDTEHLTLATGEVRVLRPHARDGALSPDGHALAFVDDPARDHRLALLDLATGEERVLADLDSGLAIYRLPRFSPDGEQIAFLAAGNGPLVVAVAAGAPPLAALRLERRHGIGDLWLVDRDGDNLRRLTELFEDAPTFSWAADGEQIVLQGATGLYQIDVPSGVVEVIGPASFHGWIDWRGAFPALPVG